MTECRPIRLSFEAILRQHRSRYLRCSHARVASDGLDRGNDRNLQVAPRG